MSVFRNVPQDHTFEVVPTRSKFVSEDLLDLRGILKELGPRRSSFPSGRASFWVLVVTSLITTALFAISGIKLYASGVNSKWICRLDSQGYLCPNSSILVAFVSALYTGAWLAVYTAPASKRSSTRKKAIHNLRPRLFNTLVSIPGLVLVASSLVLALVSGRLVDRIHAEFMELQNSIDKTILVRELGVTNVVEPSIDTISRIIDRLSRDFRWIINLTRIIAGVYAFLTILNAVVFFLATRLTFRAIKSQIKAMRSNLNLMGDVGDFRTPAIPLSVKSPSNDSSGLWTRTLTTRLSWLIRTSTMELEQEVEAQYLESPPMPSNLYAVERQEYVTGIEKQCIRCERYLTHTYWQAILILVISSSFAVMELCVASNAFGVPSKTSFEQLVILSYQWAHWTWDGGPGLILSMITCIRSFARPQPHQVAQAPNRILSSRSESTENGTVHSLQINRPEASAYARQRYAHTDSFNFFSSPFAKHVEHGGFNFSAVKARPHDQHTLCGVGDCIAPDDTSLSHLKQATWNDQSTLPQSRSAQIVGGNGDKRNIGSSQRSTKRRPSRLQFSSTTLKSRQETGKIDPIDELNNVTPKTLSPISPTRWSPVRWSFRWSSENSQSPTRLAFPGHSIRSPIRRFFPRPTSISSTLAEGDEPHKLRPFSSVTPFQKSNMIGGDVNLSEAEVGIDPMDPRRYHLPPLIASVSELEEAYTSVWPQNSHPHFVSKNMCTSPTCSDSTEALEASRVPQGVPVGLSVPRRKQSGTDIIIRTPRRPSNSTASENGQTRRNSVDRVTTVKNPSLGVGSGIIGSTISESNFSSRDDVTVRLSPRPGNQTDHVSPPTSSYPMVPDINESNDNNSVDKGPFWDTLSDFPLS